MKEVRLFIQFIGYLLALFIVIGILSKRDAITDTVASWFKDKPPTITYLKDEGSMRRKCLIVKDNDEIVHINCEGWNKL